MVVPESWHLAEEAWLESGSTAAGGDADPGMDSASSVCLVAVVEALAGHCDLNLEVY